MPADRRELRRKLFNLAAQQGGYFTAAQAKDVGYSYQAQAHHVAAGNWCRIDRGIFHFVDWVPELHDDLIRWNLWSRNRAVASHETALAVHRIGEFESPRVQLTVPPGFSMSDDSVVLHRAELPVGDVVDQGGYRVTTVTRSLIDVAAHGADEEQLSRAILQARDAGVITLRQLRSRAEMVDLRAALHIERAIQQVEAR